MRRSEEMICFFFSSRRRHTRYWRDWSSDVCSSDLEEGRRRPDERGHGARLWARDVEERDAARLRVTGVSPQVAHVEQILLLVEREGVRLVGHVDRRRRVPG